MLAIPIPYLAALLLVTAVAGGAVGIRLAARHVEARVDQRRAAHDEARLELEPSTSATGRLYAISQPVPPLGAGDSGEWWPALAADWDTGWWTPDDRRPS